MNAPIITRAALAAILLSLAACGSSSEKSSDDGGAAATTATTAKADTAQKAEKETLAVGDETTLKGLHGSMKVKVVKIEDPMKAPPAKGLIREVPRKGNRFVGVRVKLTNVGD